MTRPSSVARESINITLPWLRLSPHVAAQIWRAIDTDGPMTIEDIVNRFSRGRYGYQVLRRRGWLHVAGVRKVEGRRVALNLYGASQEPQLRLSAVTLRQRLPAIGWRLEGLQIAARKATEYQSQDEMRSTLLRISKELSTLIKFMTPPQDEDDGGGRAA